MRSRLGTVSRGEKARKFFAIVLAMAALAVPSAPVLAETGEVRFAIGPSLTFLAFAVMEREKLVEKHAVALGLPAPKVTFIRLSNNDALRDSILAGAADIAGTGVPSFLPLWARTKGTTNVLGLTAFNALPLVLVTRNPAVKTIADFTERDRIALPGVLNSTQAITLQMAAEKLWGPGQHKRLDASPTRRRKPIQPKAKYKYKDRAEYKIWY